MPSRHLSKDLLTRVASIIALGATCAFLFQNCGKAGFQRTDSNSSAMSSALGGGASSDPKVTGAPFPFVANVNQLSYMSCPMAGAAPAQVVDPFASPFYHVRAGGYDNARFATAFGLTGISETEKNNRLVAGIGLSKDFNDHINLNYGNPVDLARQESINLVLKGSPFANYQLAGALLNENGHRSTAEGDFGFDYGLIQGLFGTLGTGVMSTYLQKQKVLPSGGSQRQSWFGNMERGQQALSVSFGWGQSEVDLNNFSAQLRGSLIFHLGYTPSDENQEITQFLSNSGTDARAIGKSLYGRGYRMEFGSTWPGTDVQMPVAMMNNVTELDMTVVDQNRSDLSYSEGQKWDCFALRIVRHEDRIDPLTKRPYYDPGIYGVVTSNNQVIPGVKAACPTQEIGEADFQDPQTGQIFKRGINNELNNIRLQMARRFLPAEMWEINTDPDFLCAVPNQNAIGRGKCYASGDTDYSKFIQYDHNMNGTKPCGQGANECPAYVSICYRVK